MINEHEIRKEFHMKEENPSCKNCNFFSVDYGMMGFSDSTRCNKFNLDFDALPFNSSTFWCKDHSSVKPVNVRIKPYKPKTPVEEKPKSTFYKKDNRDAIRSGMLAAL